MFIKDRNIQDFKGFLMILTSLTMIFHYIFEIPQNVEQLYSFHVIAACPFCVFILFVDQCIFKYKLEVLQKLLLLFVSASMSYFGYFYDFFNSINRVEFVEIAKMSFISHTAFTVCLNLYVALLLTHIFRGMKFLQKPNGNWNDMGYVSMIMDIL